MAENPDQNLSTLVYDHVGNWLTTIDGLTLEAAASHWERTRHTGPVELVVFDRIRHAELRDPITKVLLVQMAEVDLPTRAVIEADLMAVAR